MPENSNRTIVTYREIAGALNKQESTKQTANAVTAVENLSPAEQNDMLVALQAALVKLEKETDKANESGDPSVLISPDHKVASLLQSYIATKSKEEKPEEQIPLAPGGKEAKFDDLDWIRWAGSFFTWWRGLKPHPLAQAQAQPDSIRDEIRVGLLADWGTGLYGAPVSAMSIEDDKSGYELLMHLGDVYYSGTDNEIQDEFLAYWPTIAGATSRACNSNHEMYTGGHAYFNQTLPAFGQQASFYALQNSHWTLIGLDTAYHEWDLQSSDDEKQGGVDQVAWLNSIVAQAGDNKIILFSHHQLFSLFDDLSKSKLAGCVSDLLNKKRLFAWYWGHEHRCVLFDQHPNFGLYGRCIGHGGYPYFRDNLANANAESQGANGTKWRRLPTKNLVPSGLVLEGPNPYVVGHEEKYGTQGYLTLEFSDAHLNEIVHTPDGTPIHVQQLA
ncbi:MAG: hypothetical protein QOH70_2051 [Blastocatellia bacterium]|jgi:hypothetical protein|nr:hypothetical protein [Blastocatellia bacterium]